MKGSPVEDKQLCRHSWARLSYRKGRLFILGLCVCKVLIETVKKESLMISEGILVPWVDDVNLKVYMKCQKEKRKPWAEYMDALHTIKAFSAPLCKHWHL